MGGLLYIEVLEVIRDMYLSPEWDFGIDGDRYQSAEEKYLAFLVAYEIENTEFFTLKTLNERLTWPYLSR